MGLISESAPIKQHSYHQPPYSMVLRYHIVLLYFQLAIFYTGCSAKIQLGNCHPERLEHEPSGPDLHDKPFCADISSWGDVEWIGKTIEKCNTTFVKERKDRWKTVRILKYI